MKTYDAYIATMQLNRPNQNDYKVLQFDLFNSESKVVDSIKLSATEYNKNKGKFKSYINVNTIIDNEKYEKDLKAYNDELVYYKIKQAELDSMFIIDLAAECGVDVSVVNKAIKMLGWIGDEYESLTDHIHNNYSKPGVFEVIYFDKRVDLLNEIINIIK